MFNSPQAKNNLPNYYFENSTWLPDIATNEIKKSIIITT
jgi:hypothetical protein